MKYSARFLSALLIFSMMLLLTPAALGAGPFPYKNQFNTDGAFSSGTDGITYNSGTMTVSDGVLKATTIGSEVADGSRAGTHLYYSFAPVTSGTLVFEVDFSKPSAFSSNSNLVSMHDSNGTEILRLATGNNTASKAHVNGNTTVRINNKEWSNNTTFGLKFEVDLDNDIWRVYQTKSKTEDGAWNYGSPLKYTDNSNPDGSFSFKAASADVAKIRFGLFHQNAGVDNFKVYKKVTATQTATGYDMLVGESQQAGITFAPIADKPTDLVWESSNDSVATVGADGLITAIAQGTSNITVKSTFYEEINYTYTVNVMTAADAIVLDKEEVTICEGDEVTFRLSPVPENTTYRDLVWSSDDDSVATVDAEGVVTGISKGTATITASAIGKNNSAISASAVVTVIKPLTGLSISASETSLSVGERTTFTAVVTPADASDVTKKWHSTNHYVATVDQSGNVTAVGKGSAEIYVSASGFTAGQTITVTSNNTDSSNRKPSLISFYTPTGYSFYDIADMEWAQSAVYSAAESGVINPDSDTIFGAKRNIKRDEFVSVVIKTLKLSSMQGSPENQETLKNFTDVPESNPYYAEIMKALELGIIQGVSETQFAPDADITRQDMAVVVTNAFKVASIKTEEGRLDFADKDSIAEYAQTSVRILSKMGIIMGKDNNLFDPLANTTRAEVCVIVDRINAVR